MGTEQFRPEDQIIIHGLEAIGGRVASTEHKLNASIFVLVAVLAGITILHAILLSGVRVQIETTCGGRP